VAECKDAPEVCEGKITILLRQKSLEFANLQTHAGSNPARSTNFQVKKCHIWITAFPPLFQRGAILNSKPRQHRHVVPASSREGQGSIIIGQTLKNSSSQYSEWARPSLQPRRLSIDSDMSFL
jgi:hypothetical protein